MPAGVKLNMPASAPPQPQSDNVGPGHRTYSMCSSVSSPEPPRPRGAFHSGGRCPYCHLYLFLFIHIWLCFEESPATKNQPADAKTLPDLLQLPLLFQEKVVGRSQEEQFWLHDC